ncbi:MAG: molybdenum cofactor biosysynthesis protein [Mycobacteriaceae bacterium]
MTTTPASGSGGANVFRYPVQVVGLLVSRTHRYAGRPSDGPCAPAGEEQRSTVEVVAGVGVPGDRYAGRTAHRDAAVSLVAVEALEAVADELGTGPLDWSATRRTVALRGVDLNALQGVDFTLDCGENPVLLGGRRPASPCAWMDTELATGAHRALRGRGGLRCAALGSGVLRVGPAELISPVALDPARAGLPAPRPTRRP